jgi:glutamyl-tRNA synthetase
VQLAERVAVRLDAGRVRRDEKGEQLLRKMGDRFGASVALAQRTLEPIGADAWNADELLARLKGAAESNSLKLGDLLQPVRVVLTGSTVSEPVNELLAVIGREESLRRLRTFDGVGT